jgi:hypothetical protein
LEGRCEYKYLLNSSEADVLRRIISERIPPDGYGGGMNYIVSSLYFDDPMHKLYYQTHDREPFRYKLRLRVYGDSNNDSSVSFFEIKSKHLGHSVKQRLCLPLGDNELLWREGKLSDKINHKDLSTARNVLDHIENERLSPAAVVSYKRLAFADPGNAELRVTFDSALCIRTDRLDLRLGTDGVEIMPWGFCVLEMKSNENLTLWLTHLISEHRLSNRSYSKYGQTPFEKVKDKKINLQGETSWATQSARMP